MKDLILFILVFSLVSCKSTHENSVQISADAITDVMNQHIAVGVRLAQHYCEKNSWPDNFFNLKEFEPKNHFTIPVEINWDWFSRSNVIINQLPDRIKIHTPKEIKDNNVVAMTSLHIVPDCDGKNINVNTSIIVGG